MSPALDPAKTEIKIDDVAVDPSKWTSAIPIDPGLHVVKAAVAGKPFLETVVNVGAQADAKTVEVSPPSEPATPSQASPGPAPLPQSTPVPPSEQARPRSADQEVTGGGSQRTISYVVAGAGVVVLGVGTAFALQAGSLKSDADKLAQSGDRGAIAKTSDARSAQTIGRIGVGLGIVAVAVGGYLFLTAKSSGSRRAESSMLSPKAPGPSGAPFPRAADSASIRLLPEAGPTWATLTLGGSW